MDEIDWETFSLGEGPNWRRICRVDPMIQAFLDCDSSVLEVRRDYAQKAWNKPGNSADLLRMIPIVVAFGAAFEDKPLHLIFFYEDRNITGRFVKVAIKTDAPRRRLLFLTIHRAYPDDYARKLKRSRLVRAHK
ncbi:MAG TPA: hypothetical protein VIL72_13590 [Beijerinckiaceae bacterium]|jgi:hypothetical protein